MSNTLTLIEKHESAWRESFHFSSTAVVYGEPETVPISEDDKKEPINPYGRSKLMIEKILDDYSSAYQFKSVRFRYFNASGADLDAELGERHVPETHLIPLILQAAAGEREAIKIFGTDYDTDDGTAVRDFVHVNDLAKAHILGLEYLLAGGDTDCFNLGSGKGYSVREVIDTVKKVTQVDFKVIETIRREGDPAYLIADSSKAGAVLGWKNEITLEQIVQTAWNFYKKV